TPPRADTLGHDSASPNPAGNDMISLDKFVSKYLGASGMWEYEYSAETAVAPQALWRCWSDMEAWPEWNDGLDEIEIDGPFEVGTEFTMTLPGGDTVRMRLVEIEPGELFTDEMDGGDFTVITEH